MFPIAILIFSTILDTTYSGSVSHKSLNKIQKLINFHLNHHPFKPQTIRIIQYTSNKTTFLTDPKIMSEIYPDFTPILVGIKRPLLKSPDPRSISTGRMVGLIEMYKYVTVIYVNDNGDFNKFLKELKLNINTRFERVLFITENSLMLNIIKSYPTVKNLKEKFLISLSETSFWADPLVYNKGDLISITNIEELQLRNKMRGNLNGRHMKVAGCEFRPWMYRTGKDFKGSYTFDGDHVKVVRSGAEKFNYTFEISYDSSYGEWHENGTWTGMYSRVYYPEAGYHFTLVLSYEYDWSYGVDYPSTINTCELMFLTNQPQTELKWYAFLLPFQKEVWAGIIISTVFLGVIQFFVMYIYHEQVIKYIVWDSAIFLPYAMAMEQGLCEIPKGARYISLVWLLVCTVLGTGYKATLRNNLSFPRPESIPTTFEELGDRPDYTIWLYTLGSLERAYIGGSNMPALINIRQRMPLQYDVDKCLRDVYTTPHSACIGWSSLIIQEAARSLTVNTRVDSLVFSKNTPKLNIQSMAFQKDSIFVDSFQRITEGVYESGLVSKWEAEENMKFRHEGISRLNKEKYKDPTLYNMLIAQATQDDSDRKPLTMLNLWAIFTFIPFGLLLASFLFGLEHYFWKREEVNEYFKRNWVKEKHFFKNRGLSSHLNVKAEDDNVVFEHKIVAQKDGEWNDPFGLLNKGNGEASGKRKSDSGFIIGNLERIEDF